MPNSLGFVEMPKGYELCNTEIHGDGHWFWRHAESDAESCIHWNKWAVYRWAKEHAGLTDKEPS